MRSRNRKRGGTAYKPTVSSTLLTGILAAVSYVGPAHANPEDGQVVGGSAVISENGKKLDIHQHTERTVIDWRSFDIEHDEHTQFYQPSTSAIALNRVRSMDPSHIRGKLTANGNVILVNPNGVFFGSLAQVDVNGLVATTADITTNDFMLGKNRFDITGNPEASIINDGLITARDAGLVGLVAPHVENNGIIAAKLGRVQLSSGDAVTIDFYGDDLLKVAVTDASIAAQLVSNTGSLTAEGGTVAMTAAAARQTIDSLIVADGTLDVHSVTQKDGIIVIGGLTPEDIERRSTAYVSVRGELDASSAAPDKKGGKIEVTGDDITVESGAQITADGPGGGGTIHIGGEYQGQGPTPTARTVTIQDDTLITANSLDRGDGGRVIAWSDQTTTFAGTIEAKGGPNGGDGGFVETSGKQILKASGTVNASAPRGEAGRWLLDPNNITILDSFGNDNITSGPTFSSTGDSAILETESIEAALNSGTSVTVQTTTSGANSQDGNILLVGSIDKTSGGDANLTLKAHRNIEIGKDNDSGNIQSTAGALNVTLHADSDNDDNGGIRVVKSTITTNGGNIVLGGGSNPTTDHAVGNNTDLAGIGVFLSGSTLSSQAGNITINGQGGGPSSSADNESNWGLRINEPTGTISKIQTTTGNISLNGIGGSKTTFDANSAVENAGIRIATAGSFIETSGGNVTIYAKGGSGGKFNDAFVSLGSTGISASGNGEISLTAELLTGNNADYGVYLNKDTNFTIGGSSYTGNVNISVASYVPQEDKNIIVQTTGNLSLSPVLANGAVIVGEAGGFGNDLKIGSAFINLQQIGGTFSIGRIDGTTAVEVKALDWGGKDVQILSGTGQIDLQAQQTNVSEFSAQAIGNIVVRNDITATGRILLRSVGASVALGNGADLTTTVFDDSALVISAASQFLNVGATLSTPNGRWLVYSANPGNSTLGGLTSDFKRYGRSYNANPPLSITESGNGLLYAVTPQLTITADNKIREYGDTNPTFTGTLSGFIDGDTQSSATTGDALYSTVATQTSNVGTYDIVPYDIGTLASELGYTFAPANGQITVTKAPLTVTADDKTREYGDANPVFTNAVTGFKLSDTQSDIDSVGSAPTTSATAASDVNTYAITSVQDYSDNNYSFTYVDGTLTVTKAPLTVTANNATREYGDANPAFTNAVTGFKLSDTQSDIDSIGSAPTTTATAASDVNTYAITSVQDYSDNNYSFTYVDGTLTVTKAPLTVTANNATREYGDTNPTFSNSVTGFKLSDSLSDIDSIGSAPTTSATAASDVNTYAITSVQDYSDNNYSFTYVDGTLTVTKAPLTVTANNATREYGDANPAFTNAVTGFKLSDTQSDIDSVGSAPTTTATAASNVNTYAITAVQDYSDNNYSFTYANGTLTVTKAPLTVTANNATREYGDANPAFTNAVTGFKLSDTQSDIDSIGSAPTTTATAASNVNTYAITAVQDYSDNNYSFTYANGTLTVTKAPLTVTANNATREYGDANPAFTNAVTGFKLSDTQSDIDSIGSAPTTTATAASNVNTYAITAVQDYSDNNYSFTYANGTLTVTKAPLTVTANNATREYGDANPAFTNAVTGFKLSDTQSDIDSIGSAPTTTATAASNVNTYAITAVQDYSDNNYSFTYANGTLTVTKAPLTVTANNATREYGDANPAFTNAVTGFKLSDTQSDIDSIGSAPTTTATAASNVNTYAITSVQDYSDNNYSFTYVDGNLTVTKAPLTVTANNATREYGDANPAFSSSFSGFKNSDTTSIINQSGAAYQTIANATSNVDDYNVTVSGMAATNYSFTYLPGTLTVTKAPLTVTANNATREYGDANPAFTNAVTGFKLSDTQSDIDSIGSAPTTTATAASNVNTYAITAVQDYSDNNYSFTYANGTLTVTKAPLTVTANNATREYGDANPAFTNAVTGFKLSDSVSDIDGIGSAPTTTATAASNVNTYAITAVQDYSDNNYSFTYVDGTLTVTKAPLTVTANNATREYGDANPAFSSSFSGFKLSDTETAVNQSSETYSTVDASSDVGSYSILPGGMTSTNYVLTYASGILTVTKAPLTVTANNATREYGDSNPTFTNSITGFKLSDNASVIDSGTVTLSSTATNGTGVGTEVITSAGTYTDNNYTFSYADGSLTITKATLTVTADDKARPAETSNPLLTGTITGFKLGDTENDIQSGSASYTTPADINSPVGIYAITTTGTFSDTRYSFAYQDGLLTVGNPLPPPPILISAGLPPSVEAAIAAGTRASFVPTNLPPEGLSSFRPQITIETASSAIETTVETSDAPTEGDAQDIDGFLEPKKIRLLIDDAISRFINLNR